MDQRSLALEKINSINPTMRILLISATLFVVACGGEEANFSNNEGAQAWLEHHNGQIPQQCIVQLVQKYGESTRIDEAAAQKARDDDLKIAGQTYATSAASEKLVAARELVLEIEKEGVAKGYPNGAYRWLIGPTTKP